MEARVVTATVTAASSGTDGHSAPVRCYTRWGPPYKTNVGPVYILKTRARLGYTAYYMPSGTQVDPGSWQTLGSFHLGRNPSPALRTPKADKAAP